MKSVYVVLCLMLLAGSLGAAAAQDITLLAPDGATVEIDRDDFGVPHITADTEPAVFFGQGFAIAQDRLFQLEQYRLAALGRTAELIADPQFLENDRFVRTTYYTEAERQAHFDALPGDVQTMLGAYVEGINAYLDSVAVNPSKYRPATFLFLATPEPWTPTHSVAVMQFFMRQFGQFGGEEMMRLDELQAQGQMWFDENRPFNDPTVPTTAWTDNTAATPRPAPYTPPPLSPGVAQGFAETLARSQAVREALRLPKLGSFAVLATPEKSATDHVLLLGAPQMGQPSEDQASVVNEVELNSPTLHVGGMAIAGIPGIAIGRNEHFAWTLTSGVSDNTDTFRETVQVANGEPTMYLYEGAFQPFETREETVFEGTTPHTFTVRRTVHGPVVAMDLDNDQVFSWQMTFWGEELNMASAFYKMWKATDLAGFEAAIAEAPMNFNIFYADRAQNVKFFHVGKLLRSNQTLDGPDPRFPREGDGTEDWGDDPFLSFAELPQEANPAQGYFVNWNNKPNASWNNGDNIPWADVNDGSFRRDLALRVAAIDAFVGPIADFTFDNLRAVYGVVRNQGSYPGTYQQLLEFTPEMIAGENLVPPGQSAFIGLVDGPSPHMGDQWDFYQQGSLKPFLFSTDRPTATETGEGVPEAFALGQNYPNPFNPTTTISFALPQPTRLTLTVYDMLGREVAVLASGAYPAGRFEVTWEATGLASGVYLYRLHTAAQSVTRLLMLQK